MPHLDAAGRLERLAAVRAGVAVAHLGGLDRAVGGEVAADHQVEHVLAVDVRAGHPAGALGDPGVDEEADLGLVGLAEHAGADVALHQRRVLGEVLLVERLDLDGLELALQALGVDLAVTGQADREGLAGAVGVLEHDQHVLQGVARGPGPVVARELLVEVVHERLDGGRVRRLLGVGGGHAVVRHGRRGGHRDRLDVRGVVARGAAHVGVLAVGGRGEELLGLGAAHRAGGGLDDHVVEPEPVEDPDVGVAVRGVGRVEAGLVDVEGVGVLHHELAAAQQAGAGPRLVAVLGLDLVEPQRQVLVGGVQVLDQEREHLLVRGAEQVVAALAVLEPEDVVAVLGPAAGRVVGLAGQQRREVHLLGADRVHLLADDPLDVAQHPVAQRQPGVDARRGAADVAGADQQPVARDLRVGGILSEGAQEQGRHPHDHARKATQRRRGAAHQFRPAAPAPGNGAPARVPRVRT